MLHLQVMYFSKLLRVLLVVIKQPSADFEYEFLTYIQCRVACNGIVIYIAQIQYYVHKCVKGLYVSQGT